MKNLFGLVVLFSLVGCMPSGSSSREPASVSSDALKDGRNTFPARIPVVNAGSDISVEDSDGNGSQLITLAGVVTKSRYPISIYRLYRNDVLISAGADASIFQSQQLVPVGSIEYTLEVEDNRHNIGSDNVVVTVRPKPVVVNTAPVVNAGADIVKVDTDNNGSESVTLAGSATDAQNNITSYKVLRNGVQVASSLNATISVPVGSHTIVMEAYDVGGLKGSDIMMITVNKPPVVNTAPVVNAGADVALTDSDRSGSEPYVLKGSASDAQNNISSYRVLLNGSQVATSLTASINVPVGTNTIVMEATDAGGLKGSDTMIITVTVPNTPPIIVVPSNSAPVVTVGGAISVTDMDKNGSEMVSVSASATDAENNITVYRVYQNGTVIFSGPNASLFNQSLNLMVGTHTIKFEAEDASGLKGSGSVTVTVNAGPVTVPSGTPPRANAGQDISIVNTEPYLGKMFINAMGSATAGSNPIASYVWKVNGVPFIRSTSPTILTSNKIYFIKGNNLLELEVTDTMGLKGSDTAIVEVKPGLTDQKWFSVNNVIPGVISISAGGEARVFIDNNGDNVELVRTTASVNSVNPISLIRWTWRGGIILAEGSTPDLLTKTFSLPVGRHTLNLTVVDSKGNTVSDHFSADIGKPVIEQVAKIPSNYDINAYLGTGDASVNMWREESAFRFRCKPSHVSYDDPIVAPGVPGGAHMHLFFGNKLTNANSTYTSLRSSGDGSCDGGPNNRSAYWMPTVIDGNGSVVLPDLITIYYKRYPGSSRIPRGLKMVFGYDSRFPEKGTQGGKWYCDSQDNSTTEGPRIVDVGSNCLATTPGGGRYQILARLGALNCWDGKNLDSPDHRSHMAACSYASGYGTCECPATHPVDIPAFTLLAAFSHNGYSDFSKWKLSSDHVVSNDPTSAPLPGGSTLHADWFGGWDDNVMDMWMDGCMDQHLNCSAGNMGLGRALKENAGFTWTTIPNRIAPPVKPISGGTTTGTTSGGTTTGTTTGGTTTGTTSGGTTTGTTTGGTTTGTTTGGTTTGTTTGGTTGSTSGGTSPVSTLGPNLFINSGFENGITGWSSFGHEIVTNAYSGTKAVRMGVTANSYFNQKVTVEPGQTYRITAYAKKEANAGNAQLYYIGKRADGTDVSIGRGVFSSSQYARLSMDVTIPAGVTSFTLYYYAAVGTGGGSYIDDITMSKITQAVSQPVLVSEGDSITANGGSYAVSYGSNVPDLSYSNSAVGGSGIAGINSRLPTVLSKKPASGKFVVTLLIGANDLGDPNLYASKIFAYADQVRAAGGKIYVATILPQTPAGPTFNVNRKVCNTLIRQAVGTRIDGVIDFAADPILGADATASNPVYFPDGLHPAGPAYDIMYWIYKAAIDPALGKAP